MKKVLLVITKSNWGGAQRYVYNLATNLMREPFEVVVALGGTGTAGSPPGELQKKLHAAGIRTIVINSFARDISVFSDIRALHELASVFKKEKPDIVHLNSSKAGGVGALAARLTGVQTVVFTSHGLAWDEDRSMLSKAAIYFFSRLTIALCHKVIVISRDNFKRVAAFAPHKTFLIHNGLPTLTFETRERARLLLAGAAGLRNPSTAHALWVGTIAELTHNKGLAYLVDAARNFANQQSIHFFIIGSGELKHELQTRIERLNVTDRVHLVGFLSDAYQYLKAFDMFVLPSIKEGLPTVLLEAGQANVPVITTDLPGARDIVTDGKHGLLVHTKDPKDLATKIESLSVNERAREQFALALHQKVAEEFSLQQMVEKTLAVYVSK